MLSHRTAPAGLLLSNMVSLIKYTREKKYDPNNYRAIANRSLSSKLCDVILLKV